MKKLSGAPWTISWGLTGMGIGPDTIWTREKGNEQSNLRMSEHVSKVVRMIRPGVQAKDFEIAALTSLSYNIGIGALASSTLMRMFNAGDRAGAAEQFKRWNKAQGKISDGLIRRRAHERRVFLGPN